MLYRDAIQEVVLPKIEAVQGQLKELARKHSDVPMLARTHGQTASPTTIGKEIAVFFHRNKKIIQCMKSLSFEAKFNGAVGNYNAHAFTFPGEDWPVLSEEFVTKSLGLSFNPLTTQIENHDWISAALDIQKRFNVVATGLCRDMWTYISMGYFKQKIVAGEVGSSTMPHKVNPIDFENAEGNFGIAGSLATHLSEKLLISRLQRDLSDSTALRSLGTVYGHTVIALASLAKGLGKVELNKTKLADDLEGAWEVLAEPVQTVMRANGVVDAYEQLKAATRGKGLDRETYLEFIKSIDGLSPDQRSRLIALTPEKYVGLASKIADQVLK
jgi:adenylosuccinate lyase